MGTRLGRLAISPCPEWSNFDEMRDRLDRILMPLVLRTYNCYKKPGIACQGAVILCGNAHKVGSFVYGKRSEVDLHVDYVSHQLVRNVFQNPSRVECLS